MNSCKYLLLRLETIQQLKKLKKEVDRNAPGITICIRRGVAADNPDQKNDDKNRPWITVETCDEIDTLLTTLIATQVMSLAHWKRSTEEDILEAQQALATLAATPLK